MSTQSNSNSWRGDSTTAPPFQYDNTKLSSPISANQWPSSFTDNTYYIPPTEEGIAERKFQELMPFIDGLLKDAYKQGFKEGLLAGVEEVEKQLSEVLTADIIKEAQSQIQDPPSEATI